VFCRLYVTLSIALQVGVLLDFKPQGHPPSVRLCHLVVFALITASTIYLFARSTYTGSSSSFCFQNNTRSLVWQNRMHLGSEVQVHPPHQNKTTRHASQQNNSTAACFARHASQRNSSATASFECRAPQRGDSTTTCLQQQHARQYCLRQHWAWGQQSAVREACHESLLWVPPGPSNLSIVIVSLYRIEMPQHCSRDCQVAHRPAHKSDCKSPLNKETWRSAWYMECRRPTFIIDDGAIHEDIRHESVK
jgi:hypothetical protein